MLLKGPYLGGRLKKIKHLSKVHMQRVRFTNPFENSHSVVDVGDEGGEGLALNYLQKSRLRIKK